MPACFEHQIPTDYQEIIQLKNHDDIDYILITDYVCFIAHDFVQASISLVISQPIQTHIYFDCRSSVDLKVRLIILFPDQADIVINTFLCGNDSSVSIVGLYALAECQNLTIKTRQTHCGKNCTSRLVMQGIISGQARVCYEGTIRIEEKASGTYALQNNKNILLSDRSSAISIPNIEVLNHDVQCYHGAAVGGFDTTQIQYMQSRGLEDRAIQELLIRALFQEPLQGYKNRELILQSVYEKI